MLTFNLSLKEYILKLWVSNNEIVIYWFYMSYAVVLVSVILRLRLRLCAEPDFKMLEKFAASTYGHNHSGKFYHSDLYGTDEHQEDSISRQPLLARI